jgi:ABC-type multidrug transport system ATPase subunit
MKSIINRLDLGEMPPQTGGELKGSLIRMPEVVAITGPNGAGKSRLLDRLPNLLEHIAVNASHSEALQAMRAKVARGREEVARFHTGPTDQEELRQMLLSSKQNDLQLAHKELAWLRCFEWTDSYQTRPTFVRLVSASPKLDPVNTAKVHDLQDAALSLQPLSPMVNSPQSALLVIQSLANGFLDAGLSETNLSEPEREIRKKRFAALNALIQEFVGTEISIHAYNDARLFNRTMNASEYSDGQKQLLAFVAALFESTVQELPAIVILDEPESHLHPDAVIRVLKRIESVASNMQIWIATHSLPLLASLEPASIWYMKDGEVVYAGNKTEDVLIGLMGGAQNVERLATFLSSPADFAMSTFISECLSSPNVTAYVHTDPQTDNIARILAAMGVRPLRVLDWGAGRGRLAQTIRQQRESNLEVPLDLEYFAYDPGCEHREECLGSMQEIVASPDDNYFNELAPLASRLEKHQANVVVLCNVLHEIDPVQWIQTLSRDIYQVLDDDGYILIAEDLVMPRGEIAHDRGFLVLDDVGIRNLFNDTDERIVVESSKVPVYEHRLKIWLVPKSLLRNITQTTIKVACEWQHDQAMRRVRDLYQNPSKAHQVGRELALRYSQIANTSLALHALGSGTSGDSRSTS